MVFFQAVLLLGYLYAHALSSRVAPRWQWPVHVGVLLAASVVLPLPVDVGEPGAADPRWWAAAGSGRDGRPAVLRAVGDGAAVAALVFADGRSQGAGSRISSMPRATPAACSDCSAYLLVEPVATRSAQAVGWAAGILGVSRRWWRRARMQHRSLPAKAGSHAVNRLPAEAKCPGRDGSRGFRLQPEGCGCRRGWSRAPHVSWRRRALWMVLALVPSTLLLGVTQHLATDVVSAPLLWVVPLALYLTTFIAAFSAQGIRDRAAVGGRRACGRAARPGPVAGGGALSDPARSRWCISRRSRCWRCCVTRASPRAAPMRRI